MQEWSDMDLAQMFAQTAKVLATQDSFVGTIEDIVAMAVAVVPGVETAGLTLARNGKIETPAATDQLAVATDLAQYETGEGPCLQAVWDDRILRVDDMATETRWPKFAERADRLGVGSMLACHLSSERGSLSALNLYARTKHAFTEQSMSLALVFATHATIALEAARLESDLRAAVQTRQGIGQAVGILMERHHLTAKQGFDLLVRTSQKLNVKLRDLAEIVATTGIDPAQTRDLAQLAGSGRAEPGKPQDPEAQRATAEAHDAIAALYEERAAASRSAAEELVRQAAQHRRAADHARSQTTPG
ncbi:GAF and ANTAR domain-containing protein [Actinophytocola sp.]|uniref:GAF and ANTAR domain-containing protein n=1 Tax=Actinophytocola sp. TaxID=1872138 RepID=UPI002D7ED4A6|nr:GAF and ANTAR domain-containing protein [Actinophytocola sp.]HET9139983.1 GAF and ANTAR domain-containing protein [Actinophytocola sp.]